MGCSYQKAITYDSRLVFVVCAMNDEITTNGEKTVVTRGEETKLTNLLVLMWTMTTSTAAQGIERKIVQGTRSQ